jgi:hypothetical protein
VSDEGSALVVSEPAEHSLEHRRYVRLIGVLLIAVVLSAVVPALLVADVPDVGRSSAWLLTLLVMVWSGVRMAVAIASGRPMLFDFFFWIFCYVFMGLAPSVQIRTGEISTTTQGISSALDVPTALLVWAGIICYELGRLLAIARGRSAASRAHVAARSARITGPQARATGVSPTRTLILVAFGFGATAYFVAKVGVGSLVLDRYTFEAIRSAVWPDSATNAVVRALAVYPLLVGIGALALLRRRATRGYALWGGVTIVVCAVLLLLTVNPISSARYSVGTVLFALAVYAGAVVTPLRTRITLVGTIVAFIFLFPLADAFRVGPVDLTRNGFFGEYAGNADYDAFWQIANAHSYVLDGLVQFGQQALGSLFFWVPRSIWPDKPIDTGILLAQYRGYSFDNLSAPLWAEFLVNGGIPFLIVGFLLVGFALRAMDVRLLPAFHAAGYWAIVGAIFPVYMTILLRGSLLQATGSVLVAIVCLLFVRRRERSGAELESSVMSPPVHGTT